MAKNKNLQPSGQKGMKICMISSSGGHYEELSMLKKLGELHKLFWVTEKTNYQADADYYLLQTDFKDVLVLPKMVINSWRTLRFWRQEKPQVVITTGTLVALPACFIAKLAGKKVVYIESFSRIYDCTKTGKLIYRIADLFIYQWEPLAEYYPNGVYGGSIF